MYRCPPEPGDVAVTCREAAATSGRALLRRFGLGPISVLPIHQVRGIGSRLMQETLRLLRERGAAGCVLVGDPGYYRRFGFRSEPSLTTPDVPAEYFLALSFGGVVPEAVVTFHEAFGA
jgi:putative acetyltransferase